MSSIWSGVLSHHQKPFIESLESGKAADLENSLNTFAISGQDWGIEWPESWTMDSARCREVIQKLEQRMGILPIKNPEQLSPTRNHILSEPHLQEIEEALRFPLSVPECFGLELSPGRIPAKFLLYCGAAFTIIESLGRCPKDVLEIGPGLGNLGLIAHRWKVNSYTAIDIPSGCVLAAYFMSKVCGEDNVWLYGEPDGHSQFAKFFPSTHCGVIGKYDLIFNSDGFPEMPESVQDKYLDLIQEHLSPDGMFLSINHESDALEQRRLWSAIKHNPRLRLASRHPFMLRDGYIEEIYRLNHILDKHSERA